MFSTKTRELLTRTASFSSRKIFKDIQSSKESPRMKKLLIVGCLFWFIHDLNCSKDATASSISQIVQEFYSKQSESFSFIVYGIKTRYLADLIDKIQSRNKMPASVQVKRFGENVQVKESAVLMFDTVRSYQEFHDRSVLSNQFEKDFHFLVYVEEISSSNFLIKKPLQSLIFQQSSFLQRVRKNSEINLETFVTFLQPDCRAWHTLSLNTFHKQTRKWTRNSFFIDKFIDFNGCEIVVSADKADRFAFEGNTLRGYGIMFIEQIAKSLNFKQKLYFGTQNFHSRYYFRVKRWDVFLFTNSARRIFFMQSSRNLYTNFGVTTIGFSTVGFTAIDVVFFVPKKELIRHFEKILLPFEDEVWFCIIFTFVVAVAVISVLKLLPKYMKKFVFGLRVQSPILNLL